MRANGRFKKTAIVLFLVVLTFLAYSNSFNCGFQFDDFDKIIQNPSVRTLDSVKDFFFGGKDYPLHDLEFRPVKFTSLALHFALFGYALWSYHLFNILLHLANTALSYLLISRILKKAGHADTSAVFFATAVFALHPVQTNAVDYITNGRTVLTVCFFYLTALYFYIIRRDGNRPALCLSMSLVFFLLGLLTKETAASLPFVIVIYDHLIDSDAGGKARRGGRLAAYGCYIAVLAGFLAWKKTVHGYASVRQTFYSPLQYFVSELKALLVYLRIVFFPVNLNADHWMRPAGFTDPWVFIGAIFIIIAGVIIFRFRKSYPAVAFFGLWFFVTLAPESTFISLRDIVVEYRLYLPAVGLFPALIIPMGRILKAGWLRSAAAAAILLLFAVLTFNRNAVWADEYSLWSDVVKKSPSNPRANSNLGRVLMSEGRYSDAIRELKYAISLDPRYEKAYFMHYNLANCYYETGMMNEAVVEYRRVITMQPSFRDAHQKLGEAYFELGRYEESKKAYMDLSKRFGRDWMSLYNMGIADMMLGRYKESQAELEGALACSRDIFDLRYNLALVYEKNGAIEKAIEQAEAARSLAIDEGQGTEAAVLLERLKKRGGNNGINYR